jgi:hypothetical protein
MAASDFSVETGNHVWAIGVDSDEGFLAESDLQDFVLTSMIKNADRVVFDTIGAFLDGRLEREMVYGTSDGAAGYSDFGGHVATFQNELDAVLVDLESGNVEIPEVTAIPSIWPEPAIHNFTVTFDGDSCVISGAPDVVDGEVVSITFVNTTDEYTTVGFAKGPTGVTDELYAERTVELGDPFEALLSLGGVPLINWTVPPNERYELRPTFGGTMPDGTHFGVGLTSCWPADSDSEETYQATIFNILER